MDVAGASYSLFEIAALDSMVNEMPCKAASLGFSEAALGVRPGMLVCEWFAANALAGRCLSIVLLLRWPRPLRNSVVQGMG